MKQELALLRAELAAQQIVIFKLFEALLFTTPSYAERLLVFLQGYAQDLQQEPDPQTPGQAHALLRYVKLLRRAQLQRDSAASTHAVLRAAMRPAHKPEASTD